MAPGLAGTLGAADNNLYCGDWVLGRQALFLDPAPTGRHYDGAMHDAKRATFASSLNSPVPDVENLYMGLVDVVQSGFDSYATFTPGNPGGHAIVGGIEPVASPPQTPQQERARHHPLGRFIRLAKLCRVSAPAISLAPTISPTSTSAWSATPIPEMDFSDANYSMTSWQIAQMHPYFTGRVSDVIIEFAGDYAGQTELLHKELLNADWIKTRQDQQNLFAVAPPRRPDRPLVRRHADLVRHGHPPARRNHPRRRAQRLRQRAAIRRIPEPDPRRQPRRFRPPCRRASTKTSATSSATARARPTGPSSSACDTACSTAAAGSARTASSACGTRSSCPSTAAANNRQ